jgi:hypothetical protein
MSNYEEDDLGKGRREMSLDVYLTGETREVECICNECGDRHTRTETEQFFSANITYNLNNMAIKAGIYKELWRPDEIGITKASQLIEPLTRGLEFIMSDPERFKVLDTPNGWGTYQCFVTWFTEYLAACKKHHDADVSVSR